MKLIRIIWLFIPFFAASCVTQKQIEYMKASSDKEFSRTQPEEYKVKPYDELFIQVYGLDETSSTFIKNKNEALGQMTPYSASLIAFPVDKDGFINFSLVGRIHVNGKTLTQVEDELKKSLTGILNQPIITVKLLSKHFTILGDVRAPGNFYYTQDNLSIFDALGMAGDISDYGNRKKVVIVRELNGKISRKEINLNKPDILASEYYYVKPNDLIYIKQMKRRFWALREFPYTVILSAITTGVLLYNVQ